MRERLFGWIPTIVTRSVRVAGWVNLAVNVAIVVTGGAVRLTASGLGCPTWPTCTADSLVNTPEMGIHGIIEFANRVLTFVLVVVALATFLLVVRLRRRRPVLFWLALVVGLGIPVQAVIGGISVLVQLNPYVVGLHFVVSAIIVALCSIFVTVLYVKTAEGQAPALIRAPGFTSPSTSSDPSAWMWSPDRRVPWCTLSSRPGWGDPSIGPFPPLWSGVGSW
jgi:heme A synthase